MRVTFVLMAAALLAADPARGQAVPADPTVVFDGSLGEPGPAPTEPLPEGGVDYRIEHTRGQVHGGNLFHSLLRLDLETGDAATFLGPDFIQNILARITGGNASSIDGLLRSEIASADLYLLNPAGVVFGANAQLDVKGSLHVSTADYLGFENGERFEATAGGMIPSLLASSPTVFGFLGDPQGISVDAGLIRVPEVLSLVGGDLRIEGTTLETRGGRIQLASVASAGEVPVDLAATDLGAFERLGQVDVTDALLDASGEPGGAVVIRGGSLRIDGSTVLVGSEGELDADPLGIDVRIAGDVIISGRSLLQTTVIGDGDGGAIEISADGFVLRESELGSYALTGPRQRPRNGEPPAPAATGSTGDITIEARDIEITQASISSSVLGRLKDAVRRVGKISVSGIDTVTISGATLTSDHFIPDQPDGPVGGVSLAAPSVRLVNETAILSRGELMDGDTAARIRADHLIIDNATIRTEHTLGLSIDVEVTGDAVLRNGARVESYNGGDIEVSAGRLDVDDAVLTSIAGCPDPALCSGDPGFPYRGAGNLAIHAGTIEVSDGGAISTRGRDFDGTRLAIQSPGLVLLDGGAIRSESFASAEPGALVVTAGRVVITGGAEIASSILFGGRGADVTLDATESITVSGSGFGTEQPGVSTIVSTGAGGDAGGISLEAPDIVLEQGAILGSPSGVLDGASGASGAVSLLGDRVSVIAGAMVNSSAFGPAAGGDIAVRATESITVSGSGALPGDEATPSVIGSATLGSGSAGTVTLEAPTVTVSDGAGVLAASDGPGRAGAIAVTGDRVVIDGGVLTVLTGGDGDAGTLEITADRVAITGGGSVDSSTFGGAGRGGDVRVTASGSIEVSGEIPSSITSVGFSPIGSSGDITLEAPAVTIADGSGVLTTALGFGNAGDVDVTAERLTLAGGAMIDSSTFSGGDGGDVILAVDHLRMSEGAQITANSLATLDLVPTGPGDAGNIVIGPSPSSGSTGRAELTGSTIQAGTLQASGGDIAINVAELILLEDGSTVDASGVQSDAGGNVEIGSPELGPTPLFIVLLDGSEILARAATSGGPGGTLEVTARAGLIVEKDSTVDAANKVVINSPEVTTNETIQRPETVFVDPSALIRPSCVAQAGQGSFTVARRRGLPVSPEGLLVAFDDFGEGGPAVAGTADEADAELPPVAGAGPADEAEPPIQVAFAAGASAFRGGRFEDAKARWAQVAAEGDAAARGTALRGLAQTQLALGEYGDSIETLQDALNLAEAAEDPQAVAAAAGSLANAYLAVGEADRAAALFSRGISLAKETEQAALAAQMLNNLGNLEASRSATEEALRAYQESARQARDAESSVVAAQAQANAARAALVLGQIEVATELLQQADLGAAALAPSHAASAVRIHLARSYEALALASPSDASVGMLRAHASLMAAIRQAKALGDDRLRSLALGNLGALYAREDRIEEALYLSRRAARAADAADAFDLLPRWYWLEGKLLWADGQAEAAVAAYQRAVDLLEETRQETLARYGGDVDFRRALAPVYLDLVDALLQGSDRLPDPARAQILLREARATMERLKAAELRDYFRNECVAELEAKARPLDEVSARTAVVYPILLPERIELLVGSAEAGLARYPVAVDAATVRRTALRFGRALQDPTARNHRETARQLYTWLIAPYAKALEAQGIDTLVFVPDGILRTIPMAALHDGQQYLVERYALAVAPSLSLVDPTPLDLERSQLLLAGISEPREVAGIAFGELAFVPAELAAVQARYGGELLLNEDFRTERVEQALDEAPPSIVHLATHAVFTGEAESSFIVTHDGKLTIDQLGEAVGRSRFAREPLELLMLSACETAAGDERAALGLAGVAVRAGARSAFGSLWSVSDEAAYEVVVAFYAELEKPGATKAQALQRAQQKLLARPQLAHPFYWAPFLLISNWL